MLSLNIKIFNFQLKFFEYSGHDETPKVCTQDRTDYMPQLWDIKWIFKANKFKCGFVTYTMRYEMDI